MYTWRGVVLWVEAVENLEHFYLMEAFLLGLCNDAEFVGSLNAALIAEEISYPALLSPIFKDMEVVMDFCAQYSLEPGATTLLCQAADVSTAAGP